MGVCTAKKDFCTASEPLPSHLHGQAFHAVHSPLKLSNSSIMAHHQDTQPWNHFVVNYRSESPDGNDQEVPSRTAQPISAAELKERQRTWRRETKARSKERKAERRRERKEAKAWRKAERDRRRKRKAERRKRREEKAARKFNEETNAGRVTEQREMKDGTIDGQNNPTPLVRLFLLPSHIY